MLPERIGALPVNSPKDIKPDEPRHLRVLPDIKPDKSIRHLEPLSEASPPPPPPEPAPWTATASEWQAWVNKRDAFENFKDERNKARAQALENDLRGTF